MNTILSLILVVPIVGAALIVLFEQFRNFIAKMKINTDLLQHVFANLTAITVLVLGVYSIFDNSLWNLNTTSDSLLKFGELEAILVSIFAFLVWMAVLFSVDYMKNKKALGNYYGLIFTLLTGLSAVVLASNYFTLFIGWELFGLSGYALVAFDREKEELLKQA